MRDEDLFRAVEFATRAHAGQFRKGTRVPYVLHPLRVASILIETESSETVVLAALLHDTIEDTSATAATITHEFGAEVAAIVEAASEPAKQAPWEDRKRHTIENLRDAPTDVLLVVCADKLDNVRSMRRGLRRAGPDFWDRFHRPRPAQAWYYRRIAIAIVEQADSEPLRSLAAKLHREVEALFSDS